MDVSPKFLFFYNFLQNILKGDIGAKGMQGHIGAEGEPGPDGSLGPKGRRGPAGISVCIFFVNE